MALTRSSIERKLEELNTLKPSHYALAAILAVQPLVGGAFTPEDHLAWLKVNQSAQPQFVDGDTITFENADLIRPFI